MIVHYMLFKDNEPYYLCNQAVVPTLSKMSKDWNKISCKNCLMQRKEWDDAYEVENDAD